MAYRASMLARSLCLPAQRGICNALGMSESTPLTLLPGIVSAWWTPEYGVYQETTGASATTAATADSDPVGTWAARTSAGSLFYATAGGAGNRPLYKTAIQGGRAVLRFDATDDFLSFTDIDTTAGLTVIAAFGRASAGIKSIPLGRSSSSPAVESPIWWTDNIIYANYGVTERDMGAADTATGAKILAMTKNGASSIARVNGATRTWSGAIDGTLSINYLGRTVSNYHNGDIYELIVSTTALTLAQIQSVESYLNTRWAVY